MHIVRPPLLFKSVYSKAIWRIKNQKNNIYLTFDDGPIPEITHWVLDCLREYEVKATFFCVGDNVRKYPEIFQRILDEGHAVGNHTFNHLKGWKQPFDVYIENIEKCQELTNTPLFRPPYGKMSYPQYKTLHRKYRIIMWDVLTGDYDARISKEQCLKYCIDYTRSGSIIVFHDNIKAIENLQYALPKALEFLKNKGFNFQLF